jgi:hypothetical protein
MILIYTPKYEAHAYTPREYAAMQVIEQQRSAWYTMVPVGKRPGFVSSGQILPQIKFSSCAIGDCIG